MLRMLDIRDVACSRYVVFRMWDARDVGCLGCGMMGMLDICDVGCWQCGMCWIRDVRDVECSKCVIFGMLNVDVGCLLGCEMLVYKMPSFVAVKLFEDLLKLFDDESNLDIDFSSNNF